MEKIIFFEISGSMYGARSFFDPQREEPYSIPLYSRLLLRSLASFRRIMTEEATREISTPVFLPMSYWILTAVHRIKKRRKPNVRRNRKVLSTAFFLKSSFISPCPCSGLWI